MVTAVHAVALDGVVRFILSLRASGQLGKVRGTAQGLEVEIIRQGFQGLERSYRIFPNVDVVNYGGDSYLVRSDSL